MSSLRKFLASKGYHQIPFTYTLSFHISLKAEINSIEGSFLLDTGASTTCVNRDCAAHFNLFSDDDTEYRGAGAGNSNLQLRLSEENNLKIGDWEKDKTNIMLLDISYINAGLREENVDEIDGVIGADILKKGQAIIDYKSNYLFLK